MVTMYVADGLRAPLMSVERFVEPSKQVLMRQRYNYVTVYYYTYLTACTSTTS